MRRLYAIAFLIVTTAALSCSGEKSNRTPPVVAEAPTASDADGPAIVFMGTSLTAGYGLDRSQAYPALLQGKIDSAGLEYRVVNAGLSGETSAGALRRVAWLFRQPVMLLAIETGANDGLRGQDPAQLKANLQAVIDRARRQDPPPALLILGMEAPPNLGPAYTEGFRAVYREVARENQARLVPFLLQGVAGVDSLNQADGIHPTPKGQAIMAETVWRVLEPMLEEQAVGVNRE